MHECDRRTDGRTFVAITGNAGDLAMLPKIYPRFYAKQQNTNTKLILTVHSGVVVGDGRRGLAIPPLPKF